jgi:hypothetical protein
MQQKAAQSVVKVMDSQTMDAIRVEVVLRGKSFPGKKKRPSGGQTKAEDLARSATTSSFAGRLPVEMFANLEKSW